MTDVDFGGRYVTFDGIALACAEAAGKDAPDLVHYNPKDFAFGKKKAFPMRDQHFFASINKVTSVCDGPLQVIALELHLRAG